MHMVSKNGVALIVMVLSVLGINVAEGDLIITIATIAQIVSGLVMAYNQVTRSDVKSFIFKK